MATTRSRKRQTLDNERAARRVKRQKAFRPKPLTHGINTRARAKIFRFVDLPGELRNMIYGHAAAAGDPMNLATLRVPASIKVSKAFFREAISSFFANTPVIASTRSSWCVMSQHIHGPEDKVGYPQFGQVSISPVVRSLPEKLVRFKKVTIEAGCCCCTDTKMRPIAKFSVVVSSAGDQGTGDQGGVGRPRASITAREVVDRDSTYDDVVEGLDKMLSKPDDILDAINAREGFNGLTVDDVRSLAMCFRAEDSEADGEHDDQW